MEHLKDRLIKESKFEDDINKCADMLIKYLPTPEDPNDTSNDKKYIEQIEKTFGELFISIQDEIHVGVFDEGIKKALVYLVKN